MNKMTIDLMRIITLGIESLSTLEVITYADAKEIIRGLEDKVYFKEEATEDD